MTKGWRLLRKRGGILDYCLSIGRERGGEMEGKGKWYGGESERDGEMGMDEMWVKAVRWEK